MRFVYLIIIFFLLNSCGSSSTKYNDEACKISEQNRFVYNYMKDNYLWYDEMPEVNYLDYDSPSSLLSALKVPKDKWSYIIKKEDFDFYYSGLGYVGFGFKIKYLNDKLYITLVYPNSPAYKADLKRGERIISINGKNVDGKDYYYVNNLLGNDQVGVRGDFKIEDANGNIRDVTMYKEQVKAPSVLKKEILNIEGENVGYLLFDRFIEPSSDELSSAFEYFKNNNISKIIIDLRYNGGGLVSVANDLVSLIIGKNYSNQISFKLLFNDKNSFKNKNYYIKHLTNSLNIDEVYFLTTNNTCSASEAVINALSPYGVDVNIIGSKTCGKPVGMVGEDYCDFYIMPIEFKITNANGEGDYFNGLTPTCSAYDDITHDFGDENEAMFKEAIYLMRNGNCSNLNARLIDTKKESREYSYEFLLKGGAI